jgi:hypothetical protein
MPERRVILRFRGQDLVLPDGRSVIGRSSACRVVIDDPSVSRRHAAVEVDGAVAHLTDLDSANGVQLNGSRVGKGSVLLKDGDVINVGGWTLRIQIRGASDSDVPDLAPGSARGGATCPPPGSVRRPPTSSRRGGRGRGAPTRVSGATELVFRVASQALDAGHVMEAVRVARGHLESVLEATRHNAEGSEESRGFAVAFAIRLAHETHDGEWFDYVVDLLHTSQTVCSPEIAEKLKSAIAVVPSVDAGKIQNYARSLRLLMRGLDSMRAAQAMDQLAAVASRKHRPAALRRQSGLSRPPTRGPA